MNDKSASTDTVFNFHDFATSLGNTTPAPYVPSTFLPLQFPNPMLGAVDPSSNVPIVLQSVAPVAPGTTPAPPLILYKGQYFACIDTAFVNNMTTSINQFGTSPLRTPELDGNNSDTSGSISLASSGYNSPSSASRRTNARISARRRASREKRSHPYSVGDPLAGLYSRMPDRLASTKRTAADLDLSDSPLDDVSTDGSVYEDDMRDDWDEDVPVKPKVKTSRSRSKSAGSSTSDTPSLKKLRNQSGGGDPPGSPGGDGDGTTKRKERKVGDFVCGVPTIRRGKGSHWTIKGLKLPEVGGPCTMRCVNRADLGRHRRESDWHQFPEKCERCGGEYNARKDARTRHMKNCLKKAQRRDYIKVHSPPPTRKTRSMSSSDEE
ncbi:hypothetical protein CPB86DRAFT_786820 [Serendipita vermifera]|nr:hypothetical protein CPB86DRAFT_786820 [Serendipita vermifera]